MTVGRSLGISTPNKRGILVGSVSLLTLSLLVSRVTAHDVHNAAPPHYLALITNSFNAGLNLHGITRRGERAGSRTTGNPAWRWRETTKYTAMLSTPSRPENGVFQAAIRHLGRVWSSLTKPARLAGHSPARTRFGRHAAVAEIC